MSTLLLVEEGADPSAPPSTQWFLYVKSGGVYARNAAGTVIGPFGSATGALLAANNLSDVANAATARDNLGVEIGADVQAYDANLDTWATKAVPTGNPVGDTDPQTLEGKVLRNPEYYTQALSISGGNVAWNMFNGSHATLTLNANATMSAPTNMVTGWVALNVTQDATGQRTLAFNAVYINPPKVQPKASSSTLMIFWCDGTNLYAQPRPQGSVFWGCTANYNPGDAGNNYFGPFAAFNSAQTVANVRKMYLNRCNITRVQVTIIVATVTGTTETASLYVRVNNTTDYLVGSTLQYDQAEQSFNFTGLNIPIADGDYIEMKVVNPTWATNPTGVTLRGFTFYEY